MNSSLLKKSFNLFIKNRVTYALLSFSILLIIGCFYGFVKVKTIEIPMSKSKSKISFFTDVTDGGKSYLINTNFTDSSVIMRYRLNNGFVTPYAGLTINDLNSMGDFSKYNKIRVRLRGRGIDNVYVHVTTKDVNVKDRSHRLADRISAVNLLLENGLIDRDISFGQFETPTWWTHAIHQSINDFGPISWDQLRTIAIVTGTSYAQDVDQELELISLEFYNDYALFTIIIVVVEFLLVLGLFVGHFVIARKSGLKHITIEYKPTPERSKTGDDMDAILDYIHANYADSELNLSKIAKSVGMPERNISKLISERYFCNFRTYINNIRIAEAVRLLKSTSLSVSEVGYKVGFNDPSSFSKTFKKITGKSPSDLLQFTDN